MKILLLQSLVFSAPALATIMTFTHGQQPLATMVNKKEARQMTSNLAARPLMQPTAARLSEPLALIVPTEQVDVPTVDEDINETPMSFSASSFTGLARGSAKHSRSIQQSARVSVSAQVVAKSVTAQVSVYGNDQSEDEPLSETSSAAVVAVARTEDAGSVTDIGKAISQVLVDSSTGMVAGEEFSSLLLSAIESASGDLPVIGI
ncbi:hypothetical protein FB639_001234 [Coemansia asiatica]|nr:hypothetical protein FB639_001234 [Coemansia asiatica]